MKNTLTLNVKSYSKIIFHPLTINFFILKDMPRKSFDIEGKISLK